MRRNRAQAKKVKGSQHKVGWAPDNEADSLEEMFEINVHALSDDEDSQKGNKLEDSD